MCYKYCCTKALQQILEAVLLLFPFQMRKPRPRKVKHPALATCSSSKRQRWGLNPDILAAESKFFTTFLAVVICLSQGCLVTQQICMEYLLCARHCAGCEDTAANRTDKVPVTEWHSDEGDRQWTSKHKVRSFRTVYVLLGK